MAVVFIVVMAWFITQENQKPELIETKTAINYIGDLDRFIMEVKALQSDEYGYKRLITTLNRMDTYKNMSLYKARNISSILDKLLNRERIELYIFNNKQPIMAVVIVISIDQKVDIESATLMIA